MRVGFAIRCASAARSAGESGLFWRFFGQTLLSCFLSGLRKFGWTEGRDFKLEVRWTEGIVDRYSQFAAELVRLNPDLIVATSTPGAQAAQRATTRIPVIFVAVSDPVASGIAASLARPKPRALLRPA